MGVFGAYRENLQVCLDNPELGVLVDMSHIYVEERVNGRRGVCRFVLAAPVGGGMVCWLNNVRAQLKGSVQELHKSIFCKNEMNAFLISWQFTEHFHVLKLRLFVMNHASWQIIGVTP